jgi:hypothetical protein
MNVCDAATIVSMEYTKIARANHPVLSAPAQDSSNIQAFDMKRMRESLENVKDGVKRHWFVYKADGTRKMSPISLHMLEQMHGRIVHLNVTAMAKEKQREYWDSVAANAQHWASLQEDNAIVFVVSIYFTQVIGHAARILTQNLYDEVFSLANKDIFPMASPGSVSPKLMDLVKKHISNLETAKAGMVKTLSHLPAVMKFVNALVPCQLPIVQGRLDEEGAKVINEVWFPQKEAEPRLRDIAIGQARSIVDMQARQRAEAEKNAAAAADEPKT